jgi:hypothetical protein
LSFFVSFAVRLFSSLASFAVKLLAKATARDYTFAFRLSPLKGGPMAKLRHIAMVVEKMQETAKFYEKAFGMQRVRETPTAIGLSDGVVSLVIIHPSTMARSSTPRKRPSPSASFSIPTARCSTSPARSMRGRFGTSPCDCDIRE